MNREAEFQVPAAAAEGAVEVGELAGEDGDELDRSTVQTTRRPLGGWPPDTDLVTLPADADFREAIKVFYRHPWRRLPLVEDGRMVGMLTVDDLVIDLVNDLDSLVRPVFGQLVFGGPDSHSAD